MIAVLWSPRRRVARILGWQRKVAQKKGRQCRTAAEPGPTIDSHSMLSDRPLAPGGPLGDLLVTQALEKEERHIAFSRCQTPVVELPIHGTTEVVEEFPSAGVPAVALRRPFNEGMTGIHERLPGPIPAPPQKDRKSEAECHQRHLEEHMRRPPVPGGVQEEIGDASNDDGEERERQEEIRTRNVGMVGHDASGKCRMSYRQVQLRHLPDGGQRRATYTAAIHEARTIQRIMT